MSFNCIAYGYAVGGIRHPATAPSYDHVPIHHKIHSLYILFISDFAKHPCKWNIFSKM